MTLPFHKYLEVKDKYYFCYFGENKDKIQQLMEIRDKLQEKYPEVEICIACSEPTPNTIQASDVKECKSHAAYCREISDKDSIEALLNE